MRAAYNRVRSDPLTEATYRVASGTSAPRLPRRDRIAIYAGLAGISAVGWLYLVRESHQMRDMSMMMSGDTWTATDLALRIAMWVAMMIGMMVPTAAPMTLVYGAVVKKARADQRYLPPMSVFVAGYVAVWSLFSVAAALAQRVLDQASLLTSDMASNNTRLGGTLILAAGIYQLTPLKQSCLRNCRSPAEFLAQHWRGGGALGALRLGARHGLYCLGCCWVLMGLLFVGGVMNLLWVALIAGFILLEKTIPFGRLGGRLAGIALVLIGLAGVTGVMTIG